MADVDVFAAIASPVRRALLDALRSGPLAVHQLADDFASTRLTALRDLLDEQA